jgi:hypothetical protein
MTTAVILALDGAVSDTLAAPLHRPAKDGAMRWRPPDVIVCRGCHNQPPCGCPAAYGLRTLGSRAAEGLR